MHAYEAEMKYLMRDMLCFGAYVYVVVLAMFWSCE